MTHILGISGSLRKASLNSALLRAASERVPSGTTLEIGSIREFPLYDGDVEASEGLPAAVVHLKERIVAADALLLVTPEYNNSIPGVFKNAIDWLSRPPKDIGRVFGGRPVALIGATPGGGGTRLAQTAFLPVFRVLGLVPFYGKSLFVADAGSVLGSETLTDPALSRRIAEYMSAFSQFIEGFRANHPS